jgi:hypothetical protein
MAVDGHLCLVVDAQVFNLVDLPDALHVSSITASTEDHCNTRVWVDVDSPLIFLFKVPGPQMSGAYHRRLTATYAIVCSFQLSQIHKAIIGYPSWCRGKH